MNRHPDRAYPDVLLRGTHPRLRVRLSVRKAAMKVTNTAKSDRKSGGGEWRDHVRTPVDR
jgi:hypothetical protein